ncbi:hypothetical protein MNBD_NITROSPINAE04-1889 [hydrothermal vent metagenome]|uniref:Uncharacterized protein n=1 Tax=hydrothermal vent metagenome TaxID=652676 RepID=A0A3B1CU61_9ZZZZ
MERDPFVSVCGKVVGYTLQAQVITFCSMMITWMRDVIIILTDPLLQDLYLKG